MQSLSRGVLEVKCRNASKGAIVKEAEGESDGSGSERDDDNIEADDADVLMSGSSNVYWLQLYNADTGALLRNMSNKAAPHFNLTGIDPSTRVAAVVITTNRQGRSEPVTLEGAVERAVGSRAGEKKIQQKRGKTPNKTKENTSRLGIVGRTEFDSAYVHPRDHFNSSLYCTSVGLCSCTVIIVPLATTPSSTDRNRL